MGYGNLEHQFWDHPELKEVGLSCRAVAAYLITSKHTTSEGYYHLPIGYACVDLNIDRPTAIGFLRALDLQRFVRYDEITEVAFVRNAMRWRPPKGEKSVAGALKRALAVPINPFRSLFYDAARMWAPDFADSLSNAGFGTEGPVEQSLFEVNPQALALPAPRALPPVRVVGADHERIEQIMVDAASISVQMSMGRGEQIRNASSVARSRLSTNRQTWQPIVAGWLEMFTVSDSDMAKALADGAHAKPYWGRVAATS